MIHERALYKYSTMLLFLFLITLFLLPSINAEVTDAQFDPKEITLLHALKMTFRQQPAIHLQKLQVEIAKGILQEEKGAFDFQIGTNLTYADENTPLVAMQKKLYNRSKSKEDITIYSLSGEKRLRRGIVLNPNIEIIRTSDRNFNQQTTNRADVNFTIILPLLKDRGRIFNTANEIAAEKEFEASQKELRHTITESIKETALAYWDYLAAYKRLKIFQDSEARIYYLLDEMKKLIAANEIPAAELDSLTGYLAGKTSDRINAEQYLFETFQNLRLLMGIDFEEGNILPIPNEEFPQPSKCLENLRMDFYLSLAYKNRADLLAIKKHFESSKFILHAIRNMQKPKLDLTINFGYKGLDEGDQVDAFYDSLHRNTGGLNINFQLKYQISIGNNRAKGILKQRKCAYQQTLINKTDLERKIYSRINVITEGLRQSVNELKKSQEAVTAYNKASDKEKKKLRLGLSTIIDVVAIEDKAMNALLSQVVCQQKYAHALVSIRFETGSLLDSDGKINMEYFKSIP